MALRMIPEAVVPQLMKTLRQDVHQESAEELDARQSARFPSACVALLVLEGHVGVVHGDDPCVGDCDAEGVAGQVIQDGLLAAPVVFAE